MRDLLVAAIVFAGIFATLRTPWVGVMLWTWLSIMNPHRYTFGFAYDAPFAAMAAVAIFLGLAFTRDRESPFKGTPVVFFFLLCIWMTVSWAFGLSPERDYPQWEKVMKINLMIFVALALLREKRHIIALAWVAAGSLALLGVKGGVFTIMNGGSARVWGPQGSFIEDNNEFGLALIICIPLLRFLQMQISSKLGRQALTATMLLCAASALGTQSRGALLAISAMALLLWWRGKSLFLGGIVIATAAAGLLAFMPDSWNARMDTIGEYETDGSAMGRISAWWTAWGIAKNYPLGVGFNAVRQDLFDLYSPYPETGARAAHSIYFQIMGNHGFVGLALFLCVFVTAWFSAGWLRSRGRLQPETQWCADLGSMCQVALIGYVVGGAFLSLAYFDLPYIIMILVVLARVWVTKRYWETEPAQQPGRFAIPGAFAVAGKG